MSDISTDIKPEKKAKKKKAIDTTKPGMYYQNTKWHTFNVCHTTHSDWKLIQHSEYN